MPRSATGLEYSPPVLRVLLWKPRTYDISVRSFFCAPAALLYSILLAGSSRVVMASTTVDFPEPMSPVRRLLAPSSRKRPHALVEGAPVEQLQTVQPEARGSAGVVRLFPSRLNSVSCRSAVICASASIVPVPVRAVAVDGVR